MPGHILVSGDEVAGVDSEARRIDFARLTPDEIYAALGSDRLPPRALVEAYGRAATLGHGETSASATAVADADLVVAAPSDLAGPVRTNAVDDSECESEWFQKQYCGEWCWLQRTGDSDQVQSDKTWVKGAACSYRGSIQFSAKYRPWYTWQNGGSWTVLEGHVRWWDRANTTDFDFKTVVREADGNGYHHGGWWIN
jgi:hypothetical protein